MTDVRESLAVFPAETPEWPPQRPRSVMLPASALDLFPSEADEVSADNRIDSTDFFLEFDSETESEASDIGPTVQREPAVAIHAAATRVAVIAAAATLLAPGPLGDQVTRHRAPTTILAATTGTNGDSGDDIAPRPVSTVTDSQSAQRSPDLHQKAPSTVATTVTRSSSPAEGRTIGAPTEAVWLIAPVSAPGDTVPPAPPAVVSADTAPPTVPSSRPDASFSFPVTPPSAAPPHAEGAAVSVDTSAVRAALDRYEAAFNALDASKAKAVWPSVNEKALARAFGQLEQQEVVLGACDVDVVGQRAAASCGGHASYVPRVGNKTARVQPRRWTFTLRKSDDRWIIEAVDLAASR